MGHRQKGKHLKRPRSAIRRLDEALNTWTNRSNGKDPQ